MNPAIKNNISHAIDLPNGVTIWPAVGTDGKLTKQTEACLAQARKVYAERAKSPSPPTPIEFIGAQRVRG